MSRRKLLPEPSATVDRNLPPQWPATDIKNINDIFTSLPARGLPCSLATVTGKKWRAVSNKFFVKPPPSAACRRTGGPVNGALPCDSTSLGPACLANVARGTGLLQTAAANAACDMRWLPHVLVVRCCVARRCMNQRDFSVLHANRAANFVGTFFCTARA